MRITLIIDKFKACLPPVLSIITGAVLLLSVHAPVFALEQNQKALFKNRVDYFDFNADTLCNTNSTITLSGDNIKDSYNYFVSKGLTPEQSAGIVGNLRQESGSLIDPTSDQPNGPGRGIAQWSEGGRWEALKSWAAKQGRKPEALDTQLEYIWHEMNNISPWKLTLPAVKSATTVEKATFEFEDKFEKAGEPNMEQRYAYAREVLAMSKNWAAGTAPATGGAGCSSGANVEGYVFPLAPQTKRDYSTLPCKGSPISYTDKYGHRASNVLSCHHDHTPAYDLMYTGVASKPVYAITDVTVIRVNTSYVMNSGADGRPCEAVQLQADNKLTGDTSFYWYGHIQNVTVSEGKRLAAGDQIGVVATPDKGPKCWGGGPHLHIDRGCKNSAGKWEMGGNDGCRDPGFMQDLLKIWEGLPPA